MSGRFAFTAEADADVLGIWSYVAEHADTARADRVVADIYDACERLADMPGMGHYRDSLLDTRHRFWGVGQHLVVYRWQTKPLEIISIVHGARDLAAYFATRPGGERR